MNVELRAGGTPVASYVTAGELPADVSPRPYLHPVRTLNGIVITELMPEDHRHHLGVSLAVPDLAGQNFWGGRTFVRGAGPTRLDNHGAQRHLDWLDSTPGQLVERLAWLAKDGRMLIDERRTLAARTVRSADCWALTFAFRLENVSGEPVEIRSPATNGRPGAGYGGFFWRAPMGPVRVFTAAAANGEEEVHGRPARWLAMAGEHWTLVFVAGDERTARDPWFVRAREYPGVGSSLAWDAPLVVPAGTAVQRTIITLVADGVRSADWAATAAAATID